jgi:LysR family hydrogen peroxide-inducible transcriptional activator
LRELLYGNPSTALLRWVAEESTFPRRRAVLVAQPSLSQQIQKLEWEVGQPLFERLPRMVVPTEAGKRLLGFARKILSDVADAQRCVDECKGEVVGRLAIGVIPTIAPYVMPRLLRSFQKQHPKVSMEIVEDVTENLARGMEDGRLDVALVSTCRGSPECASPAVGERTAARGAGC